MTFSNPAHLTNPKSKFLLLSLLLFAISTYGCQTREDEEFYSKDMAERKFIQVCQDEYNWNVKTKLIGKTLWIYLPYQKDIFQLKANRFSQASKCSVSYLKGDFQEAVFYLAYQITPLLKTEEDKGYTYGLVDEVSEDFRNLLNVIYRVYFNASVQPEFYVLILADTANGVEISYIIYNEDLKKIYNNVIPGEEQYKRILQDMRGNLAIIGDKHGRHLDYQEIDLSQFLTEQIIQRIRIKFFGADSKLCGIPEEEILQIISYVMYTYEFVDFSKIILRNLSSGSETEIGRWALEGIKEF